MTTPEVLHRYLAALDAGSVDEVLALLRPGRRGGVPALRDAAGRARSTPGCSRTRRRRAPSCGGIYVDPGDDREVALAFHYAWVLGDGTPAPFDVVDLVTLTDERDLIARLTICYDTAPLRSSWQRVASGGRPLTPG